MRTTDTDAAIDRFVVKRQIHADAVSISGRAPAHLLEPPAEQTSIPKETIVKLIFSWRHVSGRVTPDCSSDVVNNEGVSMLCCLLTDDGGQGFIETLPWVDEGISLAAKIVSGEIVQAQWDRDAWGAKLTRDQVELYSLHDEDYVQHISVASFQAALREWKGFLRIKPKLHAPHEFHI